MGQHSVDLIACEVLRQAVRSLVVRRALTAAGMTCPEGLVST